MVRGLLPGFALRLVGNDGTAGMWIGNNGEHLAPVGAKKLLPLVCGFHRGMNFFSH